MVGRVDLGKYNAAAETLENFLVQPQGGITRRPGTRYVATAASDKTIRLFRHVFSPTQSYVIEAGDEYFRFYSDQGRIVVDGTDAAITNGNFASSLTGWTDVSTGSGSSIAVTNGRSPISGGTGTAIGNMTDNSSTLAMAFDGDVTKLARNSSFRSSVPAYIGKTWSPAKTITGVRIYSPTDTKFKNSETCRLTFTLQGSDDAFATTAVDLGQWTITNDSENDRKLSFFSGIDTSTAYTSHRVKIDGGRGDLGVGVAQVIFYQTVSTTKILRLITGGASPTYIGAAEQTVSVGASYLNLRHTIRFTVSGAGSARGQVRIGTTSNGTDLLQRSIKPGQNSFSFRPTTTTFYLRFRTINEQELRIDSVSLSGGAATAVPYELTTPYDHTDLNDVRYAQSADTMWLVHPQYQPQKLVRYDHDRWSLEAVKFIDGPYLDEDPDEDISITASAATGTAITLTASSSLFGAKDVGGLWRLGPPGGVPGHSTWKTAESVSSGAVRKYADNVYVATTTATTGNSPPTHEKGSVSDGGVTWRYVNHKGWGVVRITAYTSATVVTAVVEKELDAGVVSAGTTVYRRAAFSPREGWPTCIALADGRLWYGKGTRLYGSRIGAYDDFTPEDLDDDAITWELNGEQVPRIVWVAGVAGRLFVGTVCGPYVLQANDTQDAMTPKNTRAKRINAAGCADVDAVVAGDAVLYLSNNRQRVFEIASNIQADSGVAVAEMTILADHILGNSGARHIEWAREPHSILWCLRRDGQVATFTYNRAESVSAWSRQRMGGTFESSRARAIAMTIIPGANDTSQRDEVWFVVRRTIDGETVQHVEFLEADLVYDALPEDAFFVDSGLSINSPVYITDISETSTRVVVTAPGHELSNNDYVEIESTAGSTELNTNRYLVREVSGNTFALFDASSKIAIPPSSITAWTSGGVIRRLFSSVSGLSHLKGQTVNVLGDGAEHKDKTVSSTGTVTLDRMCSKVAIGLPQSYRYKSLKIAEGGQIGPALAAFRRIPRFHVGVIGALECKAGFDPTKLSPISFRKVDDPMDRAPPLFTGEVQVDVSDGNIRDPRLHIYGDSALPLGVTHVVFEINTEDQY